jgi:hypothetical protein
VNDYHLKKNAAPWSQTETGSIAKVFGAQATFRHGPGFRGSPGAHDLRVGHDRRSKTGRAMYYCTDVH